MILWVHCSEPFKSLLTASGLDNGILCIPIPLVIINMMPWKCSLKWMDSWMRLITWLDWYLLVESTLEWQASTWKQGGCDLRDVWQREASDLQNLEIYYKVSVTLSKKKCQDQTRLFLQISREYSAPVLAPGCWGWAGLNTQAGLGRAQFCCYLQPGPTPGSEQRFRNQITNMDASERTSKRGWGKFN